MVAIAKKKVVKKKPLNNGKLHVVLGVKSLGNYEKACDDIGIGKSGVTRLLTESFVNGAIKITVPKVTQKRAIKA